MSLRLLISLLLVAAATLSGTAAQAESEENMDNYRNFYVQDIFEVSKIINEVESGEYPDDDELSESFVPVEGGRVNVFDGSFHPDAKTE